MESMENLGSMQNLGSMENLGSMKNLGSMENLKPIQETTALLGKNKMEYANGNDLDVLQELDAMKMTPTSGFCEQYSGNSAALEPACNQLTTNNCKTTSCCATTFTNGVGSCVAGNKDGPIYKTDRTGKLITHEYYYFQNKCYGTNCPV